MDFCQAYVAITEPCCQMLRQRSCLAMSSLPGTKSFEFNWIMLNHVESFWIILNHFWIILNHFESFWIVLNHFESFWIILNHFESFWIISSQWIKGKTQCLCSDRRSSNRFGRRLTCQATNKSWKIGVLEPLQNRTILRTINDMGGGALVLVSLNPPGSLELVASLAAEILLSLARTIRTIKTMTTQDETNPLWLTDCEGWDLKSGIERWEI